MDKILCRIEEMLREGIELDVPYTAIEGVLNYLEDVKSIGVRVND